MLKLKLDTAKKSAKICKMTEIWLLAQLAQR
jgi:hypothetical protein